MTLLKSSSKKSISSLASKIRKHHAFCLQQTNQKNVLLLPGIHQQLHHTFVGDLYLSGQFISTKRITGNNSHISWASYQLGAESNTKTSINSFITHFLSLIAFRNKLCCRISIGSFIAHFLSLTAFRNRTLTLHHFYTSF